MLDLESLQKTHGLDSAITDGVEITLDDNPDYTFLVKVPSQHNKAYRNMVANSVDISYDENGEVKLNSNFVAFKDAQVVAFLRHCLVSINGEKPPQDFGDRFPTVVDELMVKAQDIANKIDGEVEEAVKK